MVLPAWLAPSTMAREVSARDQPWDPGPCKAKLRMSARLISCWRMDVLMAAYQLGNWRSFFNVRGDKQYGTRRAADGWQSEHSSSLIELGFAKITSSACVFTHTERQIMVSVHGDD